MSKDTRTTILFGPPGTGKTTALLDEVHKALEQGTPPDRIGYFAFTRKAANEASARAGRRFGLDDKQLVWFRTLHSAAFRMLGLSSDEVMQQAHYNELADMLGLRFRFHYDETSERVPQGGDIGDEALSLYTRARSMNVNMLDAWNSSDPGNLTRELADTFCRTLDEYKRHYKLMDFSDFLDEVHYPLDLDLLIIDEAQDLTLQQWMFAKRLGANAKRVIIAGDDDQAIFQWAGADLRYFLSMRGNVRVLPISYRLPRTVWEKSQSIISHVQGRRAKQWMPRAEEGSVSYAALDTIDIRQGQWLLLSRLRHQCNEYVAQCRAMGVVYQHNGHWSNNTPEIRAVVNYEHLRRGEALTQRLAQSVVSFIPGDTRVPKKDYVEWDDIQWPFAGRPDWMHALTLLGDSESAYLRSIKRNGYSLVENGNVVISTIHGVKGGEADNVYVSCDTSKRVDATTFARGVEVKREALEQEHRVWYVAASRARHNLFIGPKRGRYGVDI